MEKSSIRHLAGAVLVIAAIATWIFGIIGGLTLVLLLAPIRIRVGGQMDDHQGLGYALNLDWSFGLAGLDKAEDRPWQLSVMGLRVMRFSASKKEKKIKEKKTKAIKKRSWPIARAVNEHFQTMVGILDRLTRAAFLKGRLTGRIGLSDPADTAKFGLLCRMVNRPSHRFTMALACDYDEEIIHVEVLAQATLIFGYLGLVAGMLLLQRQTRMMLRSLRHARKRRTGYAGC